VARTAAAEAPPVSLDLHECPRLDEASVRRIFAADLGTHALSEPNPYITEVNIGCEGKRVVVRVRDPLSRKTVKRSFDSTSFGDRGEARLVAIAASELVMASWGELAANPAPAVEPEGPAPAPQALETARAAVRAHRAAPTTAAPPVHNLDGPAGAPPSTANAENAQLAAEGSLEPDAVITAVPSELKRQRRQKDPHRVDAPTLRIVALGSYRAFFNGAGSLWGGGARVGEERFTIASWSLDALVESGTLSSVKVTSTTLGAMLQAFLQHRPFTWRAGVGLRAGLLSTDDGTYLGSFGWPLATTSISIFANHLVFDISAELGYGILPLSGAADPSVRGLWMSAQAGMGLAL